jgi:hypothetical protein
MLDKIINQKIEYTKKQKYIIGTITFIITALISYYLSYLLVDPNDTIYMTILKVYIVLEVVGGVIVGVKEGVGGVVGGVVGGGVVGGGVVGGGVGVVGGVLLLLLNRENYKNNFLKNILILLNIPFFIGGILGYLIIVFYVKIYATLRYLKKGIYSILNNWYNIVATKELYKYPEIIPDIEKSNRDFDILKFSYNRDLRKSDDYEDKFIGILATFIMFPFAILYRVSIISTAWFYLPLLLIKHTSKIYDEPNIKEFLSSMSQTAIAKSRISFAIFLIIIAVFTYFDSSGFLNIEDKRFIALSAILFLDIKDIEIWKILQLLSAIATIYIYLFANKYITTTNYSGKTLIYDNVKYLYWANTIRNITTTTYLIMGLLFFAYTIEIWNYSFFPTNSTKDILQNIYNLITYQPFSYTKVN